MSSSALSLTSSITKSFAAITIGFIHSCGLVIEFVFIINANNGGIELVKIVIFGIGEGELLVCMNTLA